MKMNRHVTKTVWAVGVALTMIVATGCKPAPEAPQPETPAVAEAPPPTEAIEAAAVENGAVENTDENGWRTVDAADLDEAGQAKLEKANTARQELAGRLMKRVMEASQKDGFASAVDVCHGEAPVITAEVAEKHGVKIGRTSDKLRNTTNTGRDWATPLYNKEGTPAVLLAADGSLATLNPIMLAEPCANCHGAKDQLAPGVADILAERYPDDSATGYAPGDLRGWFWVEVPES